MIFDELGQDNEDGVLGEFCFLPPGSVTKYSDNTSLEDILNGKAQGTTMCGSAEPPNTNVRIKSVPEEVVKDTSSYCVPVGSSISMILTFKGENLAGSLRISP